jgi:hypothetical protein
MNPNSKKPVNEGHLIQNREDIYKEIEKQRERERERELALVFGRTQHI